MKLRFWHYFSSIIFIFFILMIISPMKQTSPVLATTPVLQWQRLNTPQDGAAGHYVLMYNSEVNRIAIGNDNKTIYALDSQNNRLYKSSDSGYTWVDLSGRIAGGASWNEIAIAPDNASIIAVVTDNRKKVYLSIDGGNNFVNTNPILNSSEVITTIAISISYPGQGSKAWDIAVGTSTNSGNGRIFILSLGLAFIPWKDISTGVSGWGNVDVFALTFSPKYPIDKTIVAIVADTNDTYLYAGQKIAPHTAIWNSWTGYPVEIARVGEDSPPSPLTYASLALPFDYNGTDVSFRRIYASWSDGPGNNPNDDVYRLDDTRVVRLYAGEGTEFICTSLAYHGSVNSGKLLAGMRATPWAPPLPPSVQVRRSFDPHTRFPTWTDSHKPPTGRHEAQVAWSPDGKTAYCGTSTIGGSPNDESAFSKSIDDGLSWNQIGLIDTVINKVNDVEPSPRGDTLFITTVNTGAPNADSLWRSLSPSIGKWERVLARSSTGNGDNPQVKVAPDYADTKTIWYISFDTSITTQQLLVSYDGGNIFEPRASNIVLVDLAVEDKDTLYGLNKDGVVSKSINSGWTWETPVFTGLSSGYSIATAYTGSTPDNLKGHVIVGGRGTGNYDVAYSLDGGNTFTLIPTPLPAPRGDTLVLASSSYKTDGTILAMTAKGIYAWGIYSGKNLWEQWGYTSWDGWDYGFCFTGIVISRNYTAYAATLRTSPWGSNGVGRWFYPNLLANLDPDVKFETKPRGLKLSGGLEVDEPITLWAADTRPYNPPTGGVWYYADTLTWLGPAPTEPASLALTEYDPVSGRAGSMILKWQPRSLSDGYRIQIALDEDFTTLITDIGSYPYYYPHDPLKPALVLPAGGGMITDRRGNSWEVPALPAGKVYYWRVRVQSVATGDFLWSPYSWQETFTVQTGSPVKTTSTITILSPKIGTIDTILSPAFSWTPTPGTIKYEFTLARDASMTDIVTRVLTPTSACLYEGKLEPGKTYFWRVRAIEPVISDWSPVGIFTTKIEEKLPSQIAKPLSQPATPTWIWLIIFLAGGIWWLLLILFLLKRRSQ